MPQTLGFNTIANGSSLDDWRAFNERQRQADQPAVFQFCRVIETAFADKPYFMAWMAAGLV